MPVLGTIGVSLGACSLPGSTQPLFSLAADELELGLGESLINFKILKRGAQ